MIQVYVKRAKLFLGNTDGTVERRATAEPGSVVVLPEWVRDTETWFAGIKDQSIVDITPRQQMPVNEVPLPSEEERAHTEPKPLHGDFAPTDQKLAQQKEAEATLKTQGPVVTEAKKAANEPPPQTDAKSQPLEPRRDPSTAQNPEPNKSNIEPKKPAGIVGDKK